MEHTPLSLFLSPPLNPGIYVPFRRLLANLAYYLASPQDLTLDGAK